MIIPAILKEESIARMNVRTNRLLKKRSGSVLTVENGLPLTHHLQIYVVHGNAGRHDQSHPIGHCLKKFLNNVFNVGKNFIVHLTRLKEMVGNSVLNSVRSILRKLGSTRIRVFILLDRGIGRGIESLKGINRLVSNVVLPVKVWLSIIASSKGMVELKGMTISLPCAGIATWLNTGIWNARFNSLIFDFCKRIKAIFREICGGFLFRLANQEYAGS